MPIRYLAAALTVLAISTAPAAHADDAAFQNDLAQNHIGVGIMNPPTVLALGHFMCDRMREGMSPADAAQLPRGPFIDGMGIVTTAQHDICPDTLGR